MKGGANIEMFKGYKIKIYPTEEQAKLIVDFCNAARFTYNWTIAIEEENYKKGNKFIYGFDLSKEIVKLRKENKEYYWLKNIPLRVVRGGIFEAVESYKSFFKKLSQHPRFKKKNKSRMSYCVREDRCILEPNKIRCEKIGWVKTKKHNIPIGDFHYVNHHISFDGDNFWFSVNIEYPDDYFYNNKNKTEAIGIDLGIKTFAMCSNGNIYNKPNVKKEKKKLKRLQRKVSKQYSKMLSMSKKTKIKFFDIQKSNNLLKNEALIRKQYRRINNILTTNIHTITKELMKYNPKNIVLEDLNVTWLMKNKFLSDKTKESKFYEFRKILSYKCKWYGVDLIIADRWYPSSKICSCCGNKKKILKLSERTYKCEKCGLIIDRDYNAALNLRNLAL